MVNRTYYALPSIGLQCQLNWLLFGYAQKSRWSRPKLAEFLTSVMEGLGWCFASRSLRSSCCEEAAGQLADLLLIVRPGRPFPQPNPWFSFRAPDSVGSATWACFCARVELKSRCGRVPVHRQLQQFKSNSFVLANTTRNLHFYSLPIVDWVPKAVLNANDFSNQASVGIESGSLARFHANEAYCLVKACRHILA